jgi:Zn-dependent protease
MDEISTSSSVPVDPTVPAPFAPAEPPAPVPPDPAVPPLNPAQMPPPLPPQAPVDPRIAQVRAIIEQKGGGKKKAMRALLGLVISLAIFLVIGKSQFDIDMQSLLILAAVLFIHELGHSFGMLLAGYKNIRILFIPMVGAATMGTDVQPSAGKNVVMSLMGPVPGIILGAGLAVYNADHPGHYGPFLLMSINMLLFINVFNLVPINPLDGYRVLESCLFARRPRADLVVKLLMAAILAAAAVGLQSYLVGAFAAFLLLTLPIQYRWAQIAMHLADEIPPGMVLRGDRVPEPYLSRIIQVICSRPALRKSSGKNLAAFVKTIWQRVCVTSPSAAGTVFYLLLYLWCLVGGTVLSLLFYIITKQPVYHRLHPYLPFDKPDANLRAGLIVYVFPMLLAAIVAIILRLFGDRRPGTGDRRP